MPVTGAQVRYGSSGAKFDGTRFGRSNEARRNTITNIETGRYVGDEASLATIETVLTRAGVEFIDENGGGPGVRLRKRK